MYSYSANAQKAGKPELEVSGSLNFALYDDYPLGGWGSNVKLLWPVGKRNNALVATVGVDQLYEELRFDAYNYTFILTSIGYRKSIKSAFVEGKAGFGICNESSYKDFCGFIGIEPGIQKRKFSYSIDYRFISSDGLFYGEHFHTFAVRVGYRIIGR